MVPPGYWSDPASLDRFLSSLSSSLFPPRSRFSSFFALRSADFEAAGAWPLAGRPLAQTLSSAYPSFAWLPWRFGRLPARFWADPAHPRAALDLSLAARSLVRFASLRALALEELDELRSLLSEHASSPLRVLAAGYPEFQWPPWRAQRVPRVRLLPT